MQLPEPVSVALDSVNHLVFRLDEMLSPRDFRRHKHTWNRQAEALVDVIDLEVSKSVDAAYVNVGVLDPEIYARCWLTEPPKFALEPNCTVRSRLGLLMGDHDVSWPLGEEAAGDEIAAAIQEFALPFLERIHASGALKRHLEASRAMTQRYPPPIIYCALLKHRRGEKAEAEQMLRGLRARTDGPWAARIDGVLQGLGFARGDTCI